MCVCVVQCVLWFGAPLCSVNLTKLNTKVSFLPKHFLMHRNEELFCEQPRSSSQHANICSDVSAPSFQTSAPPPSADALKPSLPERFLLSNIITSINVCGDKNVAGMVLQCVCGTVYTTVDYSERYRVCYSVCVQYSVY